MDKSPRFSTPADNRPQSPNTAVCPLVRGVRGSPPQNRTQRLTGRNAGGTGTVPVPLFSFVHAYSYDYWSFSFVISRLHFWHKKLSVKEADSKPKLVASPIIWPPTCFILSTVRNPGPRFLIPTLSGNQNADLSPIGCICPKTISSPQKGHFI